MKYRLTLSVKCKHMLIPISFKIGAQALITIQWMNPCKLSACWASPRCILKHTFKQVKESRVYDSERCELIQNHTWPKIGRIPFRLISIKTCMKDPILNPICPGLFKRIWRPGGGHICPSPPMYSGFGLDIDWKGGIPTTSWLALQPVVGFPASGWFSNKCSGRFFHQWLALIQCVLG